ncbi:hypothetical protein VNO80_07482 [Phaseolus coccineus]|uniref:Uncharacterized protein n=1 Tax=Phaseolus coccineus TaxID=3886 RepID=A0AAN9RJY2_PHACN
MCCAVEPNSLAQLHYPIYLQHSPFETQTLKVQSAPSLLYGPNVKLQHCLMKTDTCIEARPLRWPLVLYLRTDPGGDQLTRFNITPKPKAKQQCLTFSAYAFGKKERMDGCTSSHP